MKKVLICGAAGMVGRTLVAEALENHQDCEVWAADINVDVFSGIESANFHAILNTELESTMQAHHFDAMLQMAFPRNVQPNQWSSGIEFCFNVLFLAKKYNVGKVVHVSSQSLYGWQREEAADEKSPVILVSPYTTGKYCAEILTRQLFESGTFTNVRLSTIIGPLTKERVVNKFIEKVIKGENIVVQGGGQFFSFLDVRDAASGLLAILLSDNVKMQAIYNVGTQKFATLIEIANKVNEIGEKRGYSGTKVVLEQGDIVLNNKIDVSAVKNDFGWEAEYTLDDSIENIFSVQITSK